ncbi:MAG: ferredoxin [Myxococcales bacterium]|nr:ferredoxin [Myxococcales bacterium]
MKLRVDPERCAGSGHCHREVPELFARGADGLCQAKRSALELPQVALAMGALDRCPNGAIELLDADYFDFPNVGP